MRSVFFISLMNSAPWGGSEEGWYAAAREAVKQGYKVSCATYHWKARESKMNVLANEGCQIYFFPNKGRQKRNLQERIQNKITKWFVIRPFLNRLPLQEYDLVIINQGYFEITTPVWKNFYKKLDKYTLLYHNYKEGQTFKPSMARTLKNWIGHSSANLFDSKRILEVLEENLKITVPGADVMINPITFPRPAEPTPYPDLSDGVYRLVVVAALDTTRKAQDVLIEALASDKWKKRGWTLELYGDGMDRKKLEKLIEARGLQEKVFVKGHSNSVMQVLKGAHLLLQITHIDAMPLAVVEAMAMSRPVVVSRIGDMPRWVQNDENGWIAEKANITDIDSTLEKAWENKERWKTMGEKCFEIFSRKFPSSAGGQLLKQAGI